MDIGQERDPPCPLQAEWQPYRKGHNSYQFQWPNPATLIADWAVGDAAPYLAANRNAPVEWNSARNSAGRGGADRGIPLLARSAKHCGLPLFDILFPRKARSEERR